MKKAALAFSGGLDTSFCAVYLKEELGRFIEKMVKLSRQIGETIILITNSGTKARRRGDDENFL